MISVVIPTYNRPDLLTRRCLPSVFAQTKPPHEILVVGDGTDAETARLMGAEPRVRFWNLPRPDYPDDPSVRWAIAGAAAINFGLDHATGDWVCVLCDDDEIAPAHHQVLLERSDDADVVYGYSEAPGHLYGSYPPRALDIVQGSYLMRASLGYRADPECVTRGRTWDADLWHRLFADRRRFVRVPYLVHRMHPSSGGYPREWAGTDREYHQ